MYLCMCQQRSAFQHALLILMGILYKLYSLYLEEECHLLDLKLLSSLIEDDANYSSQIAKLVSYLVADNTCFLHAKCMDLNVGTVNI